MAPEQHSIPGTYATELGEKWSGVVARPLIVLFYVRGQATTPDHFLARSD
ncbi:MAG: hypothetical protein ABSA91_02150 [Acidimicrobiales bacterium]|jgi:hypothetical protein